MNLVYYINSSYVDNIETCMSNHEEDAMAGWAHPEIHTANRCLLKTIQTDSPQRPLFPDTVVVGVWLET